MTSIQRLPVFVPPTIGKSFLLHGSLAALLIALVYVSPTLPPSGASDVPLTLEISPVARSGQKHTKAPLAPKIVKKLSSAGPAEASLAPPAPAAQTAESAASGSSVHSGPAGYLSELRTLIEQKKSYPRQAKTLGHEGRSEIRFSILPDGTLSSIELRKSSGSDILDEAALTLVRQVRKLSPFPDSLKLSRIDLILPIDYLLN